MSESGQKMETQKILLPSDNVFTPPEFGHFGEPIGVKRLTLHQSAAVLTAARQFGAILESFQDWLSALAKNA